jgi:hypothetical protein
VNTEGAGARKQREHINVEAAQHDLYRRWADSTRKADQLFVNMPAMFVFCAALGHAARTSRPLSGRKVDVFRWNQFSDQLDVPVLEAIAVSDSGDLSVLQDRGQIISTTETYATAGVDILRRELTGTRERSLETLAKMAVEFSGLELSTSDAVDVELD